MPNTKYQISNFKSKIAFLISVASIMIVGIVCGYPYAEKYFGEYKVPYYKYSPKQEIKSGVDISQLPPAIAVPILMYHGVTSKRDTENTEQDIFIAQMEMLKRDGYTTVTLVEIDEFMDGKKELPGKPIVITFDDGRKDSYYPTDDVFKKLGFKATLFVVSGKANDQDKFYLSWNELRIMRDSGRWEIEAHGEYSHQKIVIDEQGTEGRFLSSRIYKPKSGLESEQEYRDRVVYDYEKNLADLKNQLGITARYYAIPLNDYGYDMQSNYPDSLQFNFDLIQKYFRLAFYQANESSNVNHFAAGVYNYASTPRWRMTRIEVKNMDPVLLKRKLDEEFPKEPGLSVSNADLDLFGRAARDSYGDIYFGPLGMHLATTSEFSSVRGVFGDYHWQDYTVEAVMHRLRGKSVVLVGYVVDDKNFVSFGITNNWLFFRETIAGIETDLRGAVEIPVSVADSKNALRLVFKDGYVNAYLNNKLMFAKVKVKAPRGAVGFKVWDDNNSGEGVLESINIK